MENKSDSSEPRKIERMQGSGLTLRKLLKMSYIGELTFVYSCDKGLYQLDPEETRRIIEEALEESA